LGQLSLPAKMSAE